MTTELHLSDSTEPHLAYQEILSLLNKKYQINLESSKVLIDDTSFRLMAIHKTH
ncbi:MAG: hypothetical protein IPJ03_02235 [Ignavibacteriales bacterium]|nr:hypothetical protein [Ignavibacteriales bacterium]